MSRYEDDRWAAIDHGLEAGSDERAAKPEPPPPGIHTVIRDLADYQPAH